MCLFLVNSREISRKKKHKHFLQPVLQNLCHKSQCSINIICIYMYEFGFECGFKGIRFSGLFNGSKTPSQFPLIIYFYGQYLCILRTFYTQCSIVDDVMLNNFFTYVHTQNRQNFFFLSSMRTAITSWKSVQIFSQ